MAQNDIALNETSGFLMENKFYNNYKQIKGQLNYLYRGYNVKYLISGYLNFVFDGVTPTTRDVLKSFYLASKSIDLCKISESSSPVVVSYLINRTDYRNLANATSQYYSDSEVVDLSSLPIVKFPFYSPFYIWHLLKAFALVLRRSVGDGLKVKLNIVGVLVLLFNQIRLLEKSQASKSIKTYICFNSSYKEECLLTMFFNKRRIDTITMQHGIYCDYKLLVPFDYINFENMQAKQVLSWGQATVDYFTENGVDASKSLLFGNPKYKDVHITKINQDFTSCLVLLGRGLYVETNNKLLTLLSDYNKKHGSRIVFYIKKHPFLLDDDHKEYADISNNIIFLGREHSVEEVLKSTLVDFSISVNTTAYYESLVLGKPCFRWTESENEEFFGMDDKFDNLNAFDALLIKFKSMPQLTLLRDVQNVIRYVFNPNLQSKI